MMNRTRRRSAAAGLTLMVAGCAATCTPRETGALDRTARLALEGTRLAVEPVQSAIIDGCKTAEQLIATRAVAREITTDEARAELVPLRARCDAATMLLEKVRASHDAVADRIEAGDAHAANIELQKLNERWKALQEWGTP